MGMILDTSLLIAAERGDWEYGGLYSRPGGGTLRSERDFRFRTPHGGARIYAEIWAHLLEKGLPIGAHDLMIASTAMSRGFSVASADKRHFDKIEGLEFEWIPAA